MTQKFTGDLKRRIWFRSLGDVTSGQTDMIKLVKHDFIFFKRTEYRLRVLRFLTEFWVVSPEKPLRRSEYWLDTHFTIQSEYKQHEEE
jgi:hypothetical protein